MATTSASTLSSDQEKYLSMKLIARANFMLVAAGLCDKEKLAEGSGATANFIRYNRINVPVVTLTEGSDPTAEAMSVTAFTVTVDQWGAQIEITDLAELETSHPVVQQALELLAESAARVIDREVQIVWLAGTNVQYGDASVTTRATVTPSMKMSDSLIHRAVVNLVDGGAPARGGPSGGNAVKKGMPASINAGKHYVGVAGPHVIRDIMTATTTVGNWASTKAYTDPRSLYNGEVGEWLGVRWIETNFVPKITLLGNSTVAAAEGAASANVGGVTLLGLDVNNGSGALANSTTFYWKISRKDLLRGFEEAITIAHSTATGGSDDTFDFTMPTTAGYVYSLYFDTVSSGGTGTDATMKLVGSGNVAAGGTVSVLAVPSSGATAPANILATSGPTTVHIVYIVGEAFCSFVGLQDLQVMVTKDESIIGNVLRLKRAMGYKFSAKAMIRDQARILRMEVASSFG